MSLHIVGVDISKYKLDYLIITVNNQKIISKFTIKNDKASFEQILTSFNFLSNLEEIRTRYKSTAHYAFNFKLFLKDVHHGFASIFNHILCYIVR